MSRLKVALAAIGASAVVAASLFALNITPTNKSASDFKPTPSATPSQTTSTKPSNSAEGGIEDEDWPIPNSSKSVKNGKIKFVANATHHDVSKPLRFLKSTARAIKPNDEVAERLEEVREASKPKINKNLVSKLDDVVQKTKFGSTAGLPGGSSPAMPTIGAGFNGLGNGFSGFNVDYSPPDTNMDVSASQIVQVVNSSFVVLSKSGAVLSPAKSLNALWSGFGGDCEAYSDGDPTVVYDRIANRWIIGQFAVSQNETNLGYQRPYLECVAVSQTSDATGAYYRYSFGYNFFNDYPKMAVWPDAYYTTFNAFTSGGAWAGGYICAYDRAKMLTGAAATQQCVQGSGDGGILVASISGLTAPAPGTSAYALSIDSNNTSRMRLDRLSVVWGVNPSLSITSTSNVAIPAFSWSCPNIAGWDCIPQKSTTNVLDTLGDRLMNLFSYRKVGNRESFMASHTVDVGGITAVRWYEFRPSGTSLVKFQAGTYQPDTKHRWMPSVAMDRVGNIGMVYSIGSGTTFPSINVAGRLASDPIGFLSQGETTVKSGGGSQTGTLTRWGDYAAMVMDPADDCTFWSSTEYLNTSGTYNWRTWISKFKFANCVADATTYTVTGPSLGGVGATSSNFTVTANGAFIGNITVTPSGAGVDTTPIVLAFDGSSTSKTFTVTPTEAGTVTFSVSNDGGLTDPGSLPSYLSAVLATSFTLTGPASGYRGQTSDVFTVTPDAVYTGTITITRSGGGASGTTVLTFNGSSAAQTFTITPTQAGTVTLTPTNSGGLTNPSALTYSVLLPQPTVTAITASGAIGSTVTITGTNLSNVARVKIGGVGAASFRLVSATSVTAVVAAGTPTGQVTVIDSIGQTASSAGNFVVTYPASTLTSISPTSAKVGTSLTVSGTNLTNVTAVKVDGVSVAYYTLTATKLYVSVPAGVSLGSGKKVVITTPNGDVTSTGSVTLTSGTNTPRISRLSTSRGAVGSSVTLTGTNFASADAVYFNGVAAPFVVINATSILAAVPNTTTGVFTVHTPGGTSSGSSTFTVSGTPLVPTISSVSPNSGTEGSIVTVTGGNLTGLLGLTVNGTEAVRFWIISASQIGFVVPTGATSGAIVLTTTGGSVTKTNALTIY